MQSVSAGVNLGPLAKLQEYTKTYKPKLDMVIDVERRNMFTYCIKQYYHKNS